MVNSKPMKDYRAFTLIELLVVIVIITLLSVFALGQFIDFSSDAKVTVLNVRFAEIRRAFVGHPDVTSERGIVRDLNGQYPDALINLIERQSYPAFNPY